jgi:hypothetical protein
MGYLSYFSMMASVMLAVYFDWSARDLIWSLWLASFVTGICYIYYDILYFWLGPAGLQKAGRKNRSRPETDATRNPEKFQFGSMGSIAVKTIPAIFLMAFFTVHFGGFHFGHSVFLAALFPVENYSIAKAGSFPLDFSMYVEVAKRYWPFVVLSFLDQVDNFKGVSGDVNPGKPYGNVVRIHLLIFVFAGLMAAKAPPFASYLAVVLFFSPLGRRKLKAQQKAQ